MGTTLLQVTNVSPLATKDQLHTLFGHIGDIAELVIYPPEDRNDTPSRVCYVRFKHSTDADVAQHLFNTVFLDRALIIFPVPSNEIPNETYAYLMRAPADTTAGVLPRTANWPLDVLSMVIGKSGEQLIHTLDPRMCRLSLPTYPPLPSTTDANRVEEIRKTVLVTGLSPYTTAEEVLEFFTQAGEVRFVRLAGSEIERAAYVEFTDQPTMIKVFDLNGVLLNGKPIKIQHSNSAIIKPANLMGALLETVVPAANSSRGHSRTERSSDRHRRRSRSRSRRRSRSRSGRRKRSRSRSASRHGHSSSRRRRSPSRSPSHDRRRGGGGGGGGGGSSSSRRRKDEDDKHRSSRRRKSASREKSDSKKRRSRRSKSRSDSRKHSTRKRSRSREGGSRSDRRSSRRERERSTDRKKRSDEDKQLKTTSSSSSRRDKKREDSSRSHASNKKDNHSSSSRSLKRESDNREKSKTISKDSPVGKESRKEQQQHHHHNHHQHQPRNEETTNNNNNLNVKQEEKSNGKEENSLNGSSSDRGSHEPSPKRERVDDSPLPTGDVANNDDELSMTNKYQVKTENKYPVENGDFSADEEDVEEREDEEEENADKTSPTVQHKHKEVVGINVCSFADL